MNWNNTSAHGHIEVKSLTAELPATMHTPELRDEDETKALPIRGFGHFAVAQLRGVHGTESLCD